MNDKRYPSDWLTGLLQRAGLEVGRSVTGDSRSQRAPLERDSQNVALSESQSRCPEWGTEREKTPQGDRIGGGQGPNAIEPRMGRAVDGLSDWLDGRALFPAPPGPFQYDWESPRIASGVRHRRQRLHALGNAVVPQVVYPLMVMVREMLEEMNS